MWVILTLRNGYFNNFKVKCSGVTYFLWGIPFSANKMAFWKLPGWWWAAWVERLCEHGWHKLFLRQFGSRFAQKYHGIYHRCCWVAYFWLHVGFHSQRLLECVLEDVLSQRARVVHSVLFRHQYFFLCCPPTGFVTLNSALWTEKRIWNKRTRSSWLLGFQGGVFE